MNSRLSTDDRPIEPPPDLLRHVLDAAILAPSPSNCQPWQFELEGMSLHVIDSHRAQLLYNVDDHATLISFGGAIENIAVNGRSMFSLLPELFESRVALLPQGNDLLRDLLEPLLQCMNLVFVLLVRSVNQCSEPADELVVVCLEVE